MIESLALQALRRSAETARQNAIKAGTHLVVVLDGKITRLNPKTMEPMERRFRGTGGWAPENDYIAIRGEDSYVVWKRPDGSVKETKVNCFPLDYCEQQTKVGIWKELTDEDFSR